jgi:preprotein translocase subunit SecG
MQSMVLDVILVIIAILLIVAILLQNRGAGLGAAFGGEGNVYRTRRSFEKVLFRGTIVLAVAFFLIALARVIY